MSRMTCSNCGEIGHDFRQCVFNPSQHQHHQYSSRGGQLQATGQHRGGRDSRGVRDSSYFDDQSRNIGQRFSSHRGIGHSGGSNRYPHIPPPPNNEHYRSSYVQRPNPDEQHSGVVNVGRHQTQQHQPSQHYYQHYPRGHGYGTRAGRDAERDLRPSHFQNSSSQLLGEGNALGRTNVPRSIDEVPRCYLCDAEDHFARDCPEGHSKPIPSRRRRRKEKKQLSPEEVIASKECYNCGEKGHLSRDCTKEESQEAAARRAKDVADKKCFNCGNKGHLSRDCPHPKVEGQGNCFNCGERGHIAKECPHPKGTPPDRPLLD
eukprot:PhF_6_TR32119/c1_g1_i1/m.47533